MNKSTPQAKGIRTAYQALIGFVVGLFAVVWAVPGVPDAVTTYLADNWLSLAATFGLSTGLFAGVFAFIQNKTEDKK